jgi:hypothetical protein
MPINNPKNVSIIDLKGGGLDCGDVIKVINFWILGGGLAMMTIDDKRGRG